MQDRKDDINRIIDAILKPLRFASKDDFAHLESVKGLEHLIETLCSRAAVACDSREMCEKFTGLARTFSGFDSSKSFEEKRETVSAALELIESISLAGEEPVDVKPERTLAETTEALEKLATPLQFVKGIGPKLAERLEKKGLKTVEDILYFLPIRYEDRSSVRKIRELAPSMTATVTAEVLALGEVRYGRRKVFEMAVGDGTGILKLKWFNYRAAYMKRYKQGQWLKVYGTVTTFGHATEMIHPDIEFADDATAAGAAPEGEGLITPVYSQVENFHAKTIRKIVSEVVSAYARYAVGGVPAQVMRAHRIMEPPEAFRQLHAPGSNDLKKHQKSIADAKRSLVFDELFMLQAGLALKSGYARKESGISFSAASESTLEDKLKKALPFKLTGAQERVIAEIRSDMASPHPMNRLIQGDVGSGKTVVSLIASLLAIESGYQAALMAPTEILAEQHYLSVHRYAELLGITPVLLTGSMTKTARKAALDDIREGRAELVVGTHALIQKDVDFARLGLVVIDEQHRFGVVQRAALKKKCPVAPDMLIMTATPIPRTLSMTVFGDLDVSVIDELPPGRSPIRTRIIREKDRLRAYETIRGELRSGRQAYIVYPLVEESEELSLRDATNMKEHLERDIFAEFSVALLHGRMKPAEKEAVMKDFKEKRIDVLVSTTVIEVGVDVPNATVMLIEHAERFGLAQLHQLRGRVGRGLHPSICLLLAQWTNSEETYRRLRVMEETTDGFRIADEDLKIRGPGDFIGTRQAGLPGFRFSEALSDAGLLKAARVEAFEFVANNPELSGAEAGCVKAVLKARWTSRLELAEVG